MQLKAIYHSSQKTSLYILSHTLLFNLISKDRVSSLRPILPKIIIKNGFLDRFQHTLNLHNNQLQNGVKGVGLSQALWNNFHIALPVDRSQRIRGRGCKSIFLPRLWADYSGILVWFSLTCFKNSCLKSISKIFRTKSQDLQWKLLQNCLRFDFKGNPSQKQVEQSAKNENKSSQVIDFWAQIEASRTPKLKESSFK